MTQDENLVHLEMEWNKQGKKKEKIFHNCFVKQEINFYTRILYWYNIINNAFFHVLLVILYGHFLYAYIYIYIYISIYIFK